MDKIKKMLPYLLIILFAFYILPLLIKDSASGILILLIGIPTVCFIVSFSYAMKNSYNCLFSLLIILLFVPTIFIYYNKSASIYILMYAIISITAQFIGYLLSKKNK